MLMTSATRPGYPMATVRIIAAEVPPPGPGRREPLGLESDPAVPVNFLGLGRRTFWPAPLRDKHHAGIDQLQPAECQFGEIGGGPSLSGDTTLPVGADQPPYSLRIMLGRDVRGDQV